jgi:hypothetical protein
MDQTNQLSLQNAKYIQQLNHNVAALDQNTQMIKELIKEVARDAAALQRAVIELLKAKKIIETEEDLRLLQKFHMRHIAQIDQQIAEHQNKLDQNNL